MWTTCLGYYERNTVTYYIFSSYIDLGNEMTQKLLHTLGARYPPVSAAAYYNIPNNPSVGRRPISEKFGNKSGKFRLLVSSIVTILPTLQSKRVVTLLDLLL